jgi:hypothetical protein
MAAAPRPSASTRREKRRAFERRRRNALRAAAVCVAFLGIALSLVLSGFFVDKALHQHAHLTIILSGEQQVVPASVGIDPALWNDHALDPYAQGPSAAAVHTHGADGVLHVELASWHPCTLGDFFRIWGQPFGQGGCLWFNGPVSLTVNGNANADYGALILFEGLQIVVQGG